MKRLFLLPCIALQILAAREIRTTKKLVQAMHDRYANKWYATLTFVQKTTQYLPDSTAKIPTWYDAFSFPGTMRIDIDKERLYFVRLLEPAGRGGAQTREIQFNKYERLDQGWLSLEVIFKVDGKVLTTEEYTEPRANPRLDARLFDPRYWRSARW